MNHLNQNNPTTSQLLNLRDIQQEKAYRAEISLRSFIRQAWNVVEPSTHYYSNWHIDAICEHLEAVSNGHIRNLLINVPPRHMKSLAVSVFWPTWLWIHKPQTRWMFSSYGLGLAIRDSLKCRNIIDSNWYKNNWGHVYSLLEDQNLKARFENNKTGYRLSLSVGSATTGEGADYIIADDPHNVTETESDTIMRNTIDWWDQAMSTRLNNPRTGGKVIVMQRIKQFDLSGHTLEQGGYVHLNLPAEYEQHKKCMTAIGWSDPRKKDGELLWPDRIDKEVLDNFKKVLGPVGYAGQFQQRPMPSEGGQFQYRWFKYFMQKRNQYILESEGQKIEYDVDECWRFMTVDLAISLKQTADYTVICTWAVTPENDLLLIDRVRERMDNPTQQKVIASVFNSNEVDYIKIESVAYQLSLVQQLRKSGFPVREFKPIKDKVSRATTASVYYEGGNVYHPKKVPWLGEWEEELLLFPNAQHDDQVDNVSMACEEIYTPRRIGGIFFDVSAIDHEVNDAMESEDYDNEDDSNEDGKQSNYTGISDEEAISLWR